MPPRLFRLSFNRTIVELKQVKYELIKILVDEVLIGLL